MEISDHKDEHHSGDNEVWQDGSRRRGARSFGSRGAFLHKSSGARIAVWLTTTMADSISPECTPLKLEYDACFNSWFEGYLEPAVAASSSSQQARAAYSKAKAEEYQQKCGKLWLNYRECIQARIALLNVQWSCLLTDSAESYQGQGVDGATRPGAQGEPVEGRVFHSLELFVLALLNS